MKQKKISLTLRLLSVLMLITCQSQPVNWKQLTLALYGAIITLGVMRNICEINATNSQKELDALLIEAVKKNDKTLVEWCLDNGANINAEDKKGWTPLRTSCWKGYIEIVKLLLKQQDIDINVKDSHGQTSLYIACYKGDIETVKLLLKQQDIDINVKEDNDGWTSLHFVCRYDEYKDIVKLLLGQEGIDINAKDKNGRTPLHAACSEGYIETVKLLLGQEGIDINAKDKNGRTPLHAACSEGYIETVKLLLEQKYIDINAKDNDGWTPLHFACRYKYTEIVKLLLGQEGIDTKDKNGRTLLHTACSWGYKEIVKLLLEQKDIDINAEDSNGRTPLHIAGENGYTEIVRLMVNKGINILTLDNNNKTALYYALNNDIRNYLTNAEDELGSFMRNPFLMLPSGPLTTGLSNEQLIKIVYNLGKKDISYKSLMYWFSKMYLNPKFMDLGKKLDACKFNEFNKNDKSLMVNDHNFPNSAEKVKMACELLKFNDFDIDINFL